MIGCSGQPVGSASCDLMWQGGVVEGLLMLGFFSLFPGGSLVSSPALGRSTQPLCIHALNPPVFRVTCCPSLCAVPENPWIDSLQGRSFRSVGSWRAITWPLPGCEGSEDGGKLASNSFLKQPHPYFSLLPNFLGDLEPSIPQCFERFCDVNWDGSQHPLLPAQDTVLLVLLSYLPSSSQNFVSIFSSLISPCGSLYLLKIPLTLILVGVTSVQSMIFNSQSVHKSLCILDYFL